jgi:hypothetical protein
MGTAFNYTMLDEESEQGIILQAAPLPGDELGGLTHGKSDEFARTYTCLHL